MAMRRFSAPTPVYPAHIGPLPETASVTPNGGAIALNRVLLPGRPSELLLIRLRPAGG